MLLIDSHAKVNARDAKGDTPLHFCCSNGHDASAAILLFVRAILIFFSRGDVLREFVFSTVRT